MLFQLGDLAIDIVDTDSVIKRRVVKAKDLFFIKNSF
jgi:hypothetical protein